MVQARGLQAALGPAEVTLLPGFWKRRKDTVAQVSVPHALRELQRAGNVSLFEAAAANDAGLLSLVPFTNVNQSSSLFNVYRIFDSDVYKWLEAVAHCGTTDPHVEAWTNRLIGLIEKAQQADGYLCTYVQLLTPDRRLLDWEMAFELYDMGHLIEAAVAWKRASGDERLLRVACRLADYLADRIGAPECPIYPRHPGLEWALADLASVSGDARYLQLAERLLDRRGHQHVDYLHTPEFYSDDRPVRDARTIHGHAVMALYLLVGMHEVADATRDGQMAAAVQAQWRDLLASKRYITGGIGARHYEEGFGDPYELPLDRAYQETCAAVASNELTYRLWRATGDPQFADSFELTAYNAILPGVSIDGEAFFYDNPLQVRDVPDLAAGAGRAGRQPWFECACCPPNAMRALATMERAIAGTTATGIIIGQHIASRCKFPSPNGATITLRIENQIPLDLTSERVVVESAPGDEEWEIAIRISRWMGNVSAKVVSADGKVSTLAPEGALLRAKRKWISDDSIEIRFEAPLQSFEAHPYVSACRGTIAMRHGPFFYCFESVDKPAGDNSLEAMSVDPSAAEATEVIIHGERLPALKIPARFADYSAWQGELYAEQSAAPEADVGVSRPIVAIPYFAWGNRGHSAMRLWVPQYASPT